MQYLAATEDRRLIQDCYPCCYPRVLLSLVFAFSLKGYLNRMLLIIEVIQMVVSSRMVSLFIY